MKPSAPQPDHREKTLTALFPITIFPRWAVFGSVFLLVTLLVLSVSWFLPPRYEGTAKIWIKGLKGDFLFQPSSFQDFPTERLTFLQSRIEIFQSEEVVRRVLSAVKNNGGEVSAAQINAFRRNLTITSPPGYDLANSDHLIIRVVDSDPGRAARAANLIPLEGMRYALELKEKRAAQALPFLEKQIQSRLTQVREAEERLHRFRGISSGRPPLLTAGRDRPEWAGIQEDFLKTRTTVEETETGLTRLRQQVDRGKVPAKMVRENPTLSALVETIIKLETRLSLLRDRYPNLYPGQETLSRELERNRLRLQQELQWDLEERGLDVTILETRLKSLKETLDRFSWSAKKQFEYERCYKEYLLQEEGYQNLLRDFQQLRFSEALDNSGMPPVDFLEKAKPSPRPIRPRILFNTLLGMLAGALLGLATVVLLRFFDHTMKSAEEVERRLNIPVLGTVSGDKSSFL
ncbi:MAG: hypothetical protein AB1585_14770 [Thermodesulfobacteriota bacterium]